MVRPGAQLLVCFFLTVFIWVQVIPTASCMHVTAQTLSPCYNANLTLTSDQLTSAAGCTVVFYPPDLNDSPEVVHWTYRNADSPSLSIIVYFKEQSKVDLYHSYAGRVNFSKTNWTLQIKLQLEDEGMYQFRTNSQESKWFLLEVIEPLSQPELRSDSSLVGSTTELVCAVSRGRVDAYQWKKDGGSLPEDGRFQLSQNGSTLRIQDTAASDGGEYTCTVSNLVSWSEASLKVDPRDPSTLAVSVAVAVVAVVVIAILAIVGYKRGFFQRCFSEDSDIRSRKSINWEN
ncbi:coxsackievirus and adenovirus receptor homolog isoform X2 [Pelodiscus sinensis]|uniref:coxsackievirus and adenovirus receptor homolog isoform X2 n=1 Tax=Pelodiscus sinensis TaxID=13735 RepID=UPI003F6CEFDE